MLFENINKFLNYINHFQRILLGFGILYLYSSHFATYNIQYTTCLMVYIIYICKCVQNAELFYISILHIRTIQLLYCYYKSIINILVIIKKRYKQCLIFDLTLNIIRIENKFSIINCYCLRTILYRVIWNRIIFNTQYIIIFY